MLTRSIEVELMEADGSFLRKIVPSATDCTLRYNAAATAYLTVDGADEAVSDLIVDGVRAAVWMVTKDGATVQTERLLEGPVGDIEGSGPFGPVTFPVLDDFDWFYRILGWPKPSAALNAQTDEYARYTGTAEDRALAVIAANVTRLGLPWNVPASLGRGGAGTNKSDFRMTPLADVLVPLLNKYRLQLTLERDRATGEWDVAISEGTVYTKPLTPKSGVLSAWRWKRQRPTFTRVVAGGDGTGASRLFAQSINSTLETQLDRVLEGFVDEGSVDVSGDLVVAASDAVAAAAGQSGVDASLRESSWFRFPSAYRIGTKVTLQAGAMTATDVITEIQINHSTTGGFVVVPKVGFAVDDPQVRLTRFVADLATDVRNLERR